jgi:hypothetical protein
LRLNMRANWCEMRFQTSWIAVLLPTKVADICVCGCVDV